MCQRGSEKPDIANVTLEKPFLPTDFLALLEKVKNVIESHRSLSAEVISLDENDEDVSVFDIDSINGLEEDENEDEEILSLENPPEELYKDTEGIKTLDTPDEDDEMELPTFDLDTKEEELELPFTNSNEAIQSANPNQVEDTLDEMMIENAPSILDKDDIDEVRQLLDDDENESEKAFDFEDISLNTLKEESHEEDFSLDEEQEEEVVSSTLEEDAPESLGSMFEDVDDTLLSESAEDDGLEEERDFKNDPFETQEAEPLALGGLDEDEPMSLGSAFEDIKEETLLPEEDYDVDEDIAKDEETSMEIQEDIIDDFQEEIAEQSREERENEEEIIAPKVAVEANLAENVLSLDELSENLIKKAFGEEVNEEEAPQAQEASHEIEVIRGEIENSISKSISSFAQSDILREALKGMKINISITFDDKN